MAKSVRSQPAKSMGSEAKYSVDDIAHIAAITRNVPQQADVAGNSDLPDTHWMQVVRTMIADSEIRADGKMAVLESKIDAKLAKIDQLPSLAQLIGSLAVTGIAIIGVTIAVITFGSSRFDGGAQFASSLVGQTLEAKRQSEENAKQISVLLDLLKRKINEPSSEKKL